MKNELELKKLQTMKTKIVCEIDDLKRQKSTLEQTLSLKSSQIQKIISQINNLKSDGIIVSEHAILRYIERVLEVDIEKIKQNIATDEVMNYAKTLGNGTFPNDGFRVKIVDNIVVTVLTGADEVN